LLEDEPRFDYSGGATCPSLLLEPSRTNLVPYSEYFDDWTENIPSLTANQGISPEGVQNAYSYQASSSSRYVVFKTIPVVSGTTYTLSMWVKSNSGTQKIRIGADNACSNPQGAETFEVGTEWQRISTTITSTQTSWNLFFDNIESGIACTGTQLSADLLIYGFQAEQGSYPTSYIPNHSGGSVTRGADDSVTTGLGSIAGQSEGTLFAYFETIGDSSTPYISLNQDNGVTNRVLIYNNTGVCAEVRSGGTIQASLTTSTQGLVKAAIAYKENDFAFYINGSQIGTDTSGSTFGAGVLNELNLGFGNQDGAEIKQVLLFNNRLSNTDLATLTTL
jgi:hypothetical protein